MCDLHIFNIVYINFSFYIPEQIIIIRKQKYITNSDDRNKACLLVNNMREIKINNCTNRIGHYLLEIERITGEYLFCFF